MISQAPSRRPDQRRDFADLPDLGFITKVFPPRRRRDLIDRPRLLEALRSGAEADVTGVVAPPGYGKTTLLQQYIALSDAAPCWLTLDSFDGESERLLQYLILAFDRRIPGLAGALLPSLSASDGAPQRIEESLARLVTTIHLQGEGPFLLVIDEIHLLDGSASARAVLAPFLQHLPQNCRVLLSGRKLPDLPVLHRLRARRQLELIGVEDLTFRHEEALALVELLAGGKRTAAEAEAMLLQTEGWAAGLAAIAQTGQKVAAHTPDSAGGLFGYLCAEAYDALPEDRQELLLVASVPRHLSAELLDGLIGDGAGDKIEDLEAEALFLQPIDGPRPTYRFHQLYRDFLQQRLKRTARERYHLLHAQTATLLADAGEWQEAIYHCIEAVDWNQAASIIEQAAPAAGRLGHWRGLLDAISSLPESTVAEQPSLLLLEAQAASRIGDVIRATRILDRLMPGLVDYGPSLHLAQALLLRGFTLRLSGRLQEAREQLTRSATMLQQFDAPSSLIAEVYRQLGSCSTLLGEDDLAQEELQRSLSVFEALGDLANQARVHDALGWPLNKTGRTGAAMRHVELAGKLWRELDNYSELAGNLVNLGTIYLEQGDQERAQSSFVDALAAARSSANQRAEAYALLGLGDVALAREDPGLAARNFGEALDRAATLGESFSLTYACCGLAESRRQLGEAVEAETLLTDKLAELGPEGNRLERARCLYFLGLAQRDDRNAEAAICSLTEAAGQFANQHARREEARACFALASLQFELRHRRPAMQLLERVAEILRELGSEQCIAAEAQRAPLMLQYAAAKRVASGLYERMVERLLDQPAQSVAWSLPHHYPRVTVQAFGPVEVNVGMRQVTDLEWRSPSSKELFLYFLCHREEQRKEEIVATMWPDLELKHCNSQFHSNLHRLRQAVYVECLIHSNGRYGLNPSGSFDFDVATFQQLLAEGESYPRGSEQRASCFREALKLYRGPFAEEFYSEWTYTVRDQLMNRFLGASASLAGHYAGRGEYQTSIELCRGILAVDQYHEGATLELMSSLAAQGDLSEALRVYRVYAQLLHDDGIGQPPVAHRRLFQRLAGELTAAV